MNLMSFKKILAFFSLLGLLLGIIATVNAEDRNVPAELAEKLAKIFKGVSAEDIKATPMEGWYQVANGVTLGYISEDGRYLIQGDLIDLETDDNLSEIQRAGMRRQIMAEVDVDQLITFAPENPKHWVTVFTDAGCGYCRVLHQQMAAYNANGIGVRYAFDPAGGPGSPAFKQAEAVWCADDRNAAMTAAKKGQTLPEGNCKNPIVEQWQLAGKLGSTGTPGIITEDGRIIRGYRPPAALLQILEAK